MEAMKCAQLIAHGLQQILREAAGTVELSYTATDLTFSGVLDVPLRGPLRSYPAFAKSEASWAHFTLTGQIVYHHFQKISPYLRFTVSEAAHNLELVWTMEIDKLSLFPDVYGKIFAEEILMYAERGQPIPFVVDKF